MARLVGSMFERSHYRQAPVNDPVSSLVLDRYLESLDGARSYFGHAPAVTVPPSIVARVEGTGRELGEVIDEVAGSTDVRSREGGVALSGLRLCWLRRGRLEQGQGCGKLTGRPFEVLDRHR